MTYYLQHSEWLSSISMPEGMNLEMLNTPDRIERILKPVLKETANNKIVVDLGAGTGILGLYASEVGATFVYFVERDPQMFHILSNVMPKKLPADKFKLINKDIEELSIDDFDCGTPDIVVSEFYGPRLFDEGYVNYTKHIKSFLPDCYFIPETFEVEFYLSDIDYNQPIWPHNALLTDHFKFMYKEKGFSKYIDFNEEQYVGSIKFSANEQLFSNSIEFTYDKTDERLLVGKALIKHQDLTQTFTTMGWLMTEEDFAKTFKVFFDTDNYFNPRKIEL